MTAGNLGALFKSAMGGGGLAVVDPDEDEFDLDEVSELEKFEPTRVDGVNGPANGCPTLMLKALGSGKGRVSTPIATRLVKTSGDEKRVSVHLAYPSNRPDRARAADGFRDFAGPDAVEDAAWSFMKAGAEIGLWHEDGTTGSGTCVESWVHRADPWVIKAVDGSTQTIMPGDWLLAIQWPPDTWQLVKSGLINGVSMQGSAVRRKPSPEALAGLRKGKGGKKAARRLAKAQEARLRSALAPIVAERMAELHTRIADLRGQFSDMEQGQAARLGSRAEEFTGSVEGWAVKGRTGQSVAVAKSGKQAARFAREYDRVMAGTAGRKARGRVLARMQDTAMQEAARTAGNPRCGKCGRFSKLAGAHFCTKCGFKVGDAVKADGPILADTGDHKPSRRCKNCKTTFHSERPACPHCGLIADPGGVAKSAGTVSATLTDAEQLHAAAVLSKARSDDPERRLAGIGELFEKAGPEIATRIMAGDLVSPAQFARAFITRNRAPLSAPAGSSGPRIPQATHTISSDDFTRDPLTAGHQRPSQALDRLNELLQPGGGRAAYYRQSPGIAPSDPYAPASGAPSSTTVRPGLARTQSMFSRPPAPGDARPW